MDINDINLTLEMRGRSCLFRSFWSVQSSQGESRQVERRKEVEGSSQWWPQNSPEIHGLGPVGKTGGAWVGWVGCRTHEVWVMKLIQTVKRRMGWVAKDMVLRVMKNYFWDDQNSLCKLWNCWWWMNFKLCSLYCLDFWQLYGTLIQGSFRMSESVELIPRSNKCFSLRSHNGTLCT